MSAHNGDDDGKPSRGSSGVLGLCGSLRARSSNRLALDALASIGGAALGLVVYEHLRDIPTYDPDHEADLPPIVADLRTRIGASSWLVISSPEYAHGIVGSLKNCLDWLVGSETFPGIRVAIINASPRAHHANDQLREILKTMSAEVVEDACIELLLIGRSFTVEELLADPDLRAPLDACARRIASDKLNPRNEY